MGDTTKILAVSYGTFSCRLEGFDDSVETMKSVVSYFHELAGHDRFMDMEPQQPDMDTLAELTAEQTGEEVVAEGGPGHVSLRVKKDAEEEEERPSLRLRRPGRVTRVLTEPGVDPLLGVDDEDDDLLAEELAALDDDEQDVDENDITLMSDDEDEDDMPVADEAEDEDGIEDDMLNAAVEELDEAEPVESTPAAYTPEPTDLPADSDDSVAAKLQRIRAVVGRGHVAPAAPADEEAEASAETEQSGADAPLSLRLADLARQNAELDADDAEAVAEEEIIDALEDDLAEEDAAFDENDAVEAELTEEDEAEEEAVAEDVTSEPLVLTEAEPADAPEMTEDMAGDDDTAEPEEVAELEETVEAAAEDDDDADQSAELELNEDEAAEDEVAAVEEADDAEAEEPQVAMRRQNRSKRADLPENDDEAMRRILTQADERLAEPEGRRHRDAFAQLKAAVAATEAARQLGDPGAATRDSDEAFRDDLDAHETTDDTQSGRPLSTPLKLVASQLVDVNEQPADDAAARLRQIASKKDAGGAGGSGFAEFAREKGATELADLLEAAAAYIAFVEGDDDFSRPQVMKKVQMASSDQFSREDGLRSFGRLLRQSKIIKLNNGRFQIAEDTRFRPDNKAAQG